MSVGEVVAVVITVVAVGLMVAFAAYFMWVNRDIPENDGCPQE